eukprot:1044910-Rhodomonas_salina.2
MMMTRRTRRRRRKGRKERRLQRGKEEEDYDDDDVDDHDHDDDDGLNRRWLALNSPGYIGGVWRRAEFVAVKESKLRRLEEQEKGEEEEGEGEGGRERGGEEEKERERERRRAEMEKLKKEPTRALRADLARATYARAGTGLAYAATLPAYAVLRSVRY